MENLLLIKDIDIILFELFLKVYDKKRNTNLLEIYNLLFKEKCSKEKVCQTLYYDQRTIYRKQKEILEIKSIIFDELKNGVL